MKKLVLVAVLLGALTVGCGGSRAPATSAETSVESTATASTTPTSSIPEAAKTYFDAMATHSPRMLEVSAPGSPAHAYAQLQLGQQEASRAAGYPYPPGTVTVEGATVRSCQDGGGCVAFSSFALNSAGQLSDFTINGSPVASRIVAGGQTAEAGGMKFRLVGALQLSSADGMVAVVEATNGSQSMTSDSRGLLVSWYDAAYIGPDGRQLTATNYAGPTDLRLGATAPYALQFEGAKPGGTLHISGWKDNKPWEIRFKL
ncbi:MAG: hypothetical protein M3O70_15210 [Actinomycetota bacterium]|nr:hypothetical protein [Actinomycetota bacterium]